MSFSRPGALATLTLCGLLLLGCSTAPAAAPTPAPTKAAAPASATAAAPGAAPTKAAEPTKAPAAAPAVNFPEKGRAITLVVPFAAGGGSDIAVRLLQPYLEKELGTAITVLNKGGAGMQIGVTEAIKAKPDGYTVGHANWPAICTLYLDKERGAAFSRKDFQTVAMHVTDPLGISVKADSPFKTIKDIVDAAKAAPEKVKVGAAGGLQSPEDFGWRLLEKQAGIKLSIVQFDGAGPANTALLGGHIDAMGAGISSQVSPYKSGQTRIIATFADEGKKVVPGIQTMKEMGYDGYFANSRGWFVPAGTPKEVVTVLTNAIKKAQENPEYIGKLEAQGQFSKYMGPDEFAKFWEDMEKFIIPLLEDYKKDTK